MPTFATPAPITLRLTVDAGQVTVDATDRDDTVVEVAPADPNDPTDVEGAEQTRVEHRIGTVIVEAPKQHGMFRRSPELVVRVALPTGSSAKLTAASADIHVTGSLGTAEVTTSSGDLSLDHADRVEAKTASGDAWCRTVERDALVQTASGDIAVQSVGGRAQLGTASGDVQLHEARGDIRVQTASGDLHVDDAHGSVVAKAASGDIVLRSVRRGRIAADTASGDIVIGVADGTAAWLDVSTLSGEVTSGLSSADQPGEGEETVEIHARTVGGDIIITRTGS